MEDAVRATAQMVYNRAVSTTVPALAPDVGAIVSVELSPPAAAAALVAAAA